MAFATKSDWFRLTAMICVVLMAPGEVPLIAQGQSPPAQPESEAPKLKSPEQLDSLVAPVALYPDPLLGQLLAASTYPVEIVEANRWLKSNANLKGENLTKAAAKQPWDPSVQALVAFPAALKRLDENIRWTTELGNAVLDQQQDVMDAVQRMRSKAKDGGKLQSSKEQKVEVKTVEKKTVIEIQPSNPQVIYVPSYDPVVVYGAPPPAYAYPPLYYPPYTPGAVAATAAVSFGVGVMMGAFWGGCCGGGWGWGCHWGGSANININNNFYNRYGYNNINGGNRVNGGNGWQHNPAHRRATPYSSARTAQRYGGTSRGVDRGRQSADRGVGDNRGRDGVGNNRGRDGVGDNRGRDGVGDNRGRDGAGDRNRSGVGDNKGRDNNVGDRGRSGGGNQDRVGNRNIENRGSQSALGGGESRSRAQASSDRGFNSSRGGSSTAAGGAARGGGGGGGRSSGGGGGGGGRGGRGGRR